MSILAVAICDRCGESISCKHVEKTYVAERIMEEGWSVTKKNGKETVLCPFCKHRKKGTKVL